MWSFGIVMTHCCGLSTITGFIAQLLDAEENTIRQILKDWYREGQNKNGRKRADIEVKASFVPLLQWIISWWGTQEKSLVLAADASTLGERFTMLVICVVIRGCGIPVAWKILPGNQKGSWKPYWQELFKQIEKGIPDDWFVIVTTDRGLYASWLYQAIIEAGWHPFMRIKSQGSFSGANNGDWKPLKKLITEVGVDWSGKVTIFRTNPIKCTLLGRWSDGHTDPWLIVTDLDPEDAQICWYSMRCWIECLFKDIKRGGFGWHNTKMTDPKRAERLWLAIAVATLWLVSVGSNTDREKYTGTDEKVHPTSTSVVVEDYSSVGVPADPITASMTPVEPISNTVVAENNESFLPGAQTNTPTTPTTFMEDTVVAPSIDSQIKQIVVPTISCFRRGFITILAALLKGDPIPTGQFIPDFSPAPG